MKNEREKILYSTSCIKSRDICSGRRKLVKMLIYYFSIPFSFIFICLDLPRFMNFFAIAECII